MSVIDQSKIRNFCIIAHIDQVKHIFLPVVCLIYGTNRLCFNRNSALSFKLHVVKHLRLHLSARQEACLFNNPVC